MNYHEIRQIDDIAKTVMTRDYKRCYGTFHYPHGWLGFNYSFSGVCPTIDSGIWKHHTLLIEVEKIQNEQK